MKFCPKCDSILLPKKTGRSFKLVCQRCKYTRRLKDKSDIKGYKISEEGKEASEVAIIEEKKEKKKKPREPEYEIEMEYYEDLYE